MMGVPKVGDKVVLNGEEWEVIDVYGLDDMIEDGLGYELPQRYEGKRVIATIGVFEKFIEGKDPVKDFLQRPEVQKVLALAYLMGADLYPFKLDGVEVWLDWNGYAFTFMLPEEY
ncbi:protein of unknown function (plasmid) [Thermococcus nautili]|uniref:hypothetical protein n=1 Tax=Thermococcus nautili TaxID=195522 RepID=UPI002553F0F9|nr:hypothetical protein [Thermococcus nautili]CAI1494163.1 protein of unknown function [Thermococcus nautili]